MIPSLLLRKLGICVSLIAALGLATFASTASADGNGAQVQPNQVSVMSTRNPCTRVPGTLTITYTLIRHVTTHDSGAAEATVHLVGTLLFVPNDSSQPTYTGQFTLFFGNEDNLQNEVSQKVSNIEAIGSDGSHLNFHEVQVTVSANGVVTVSFDKTHCS